MSDELCRATWAGDLNAVQAMVTAGADVNTPNRHGQGSLLTEHPHVIDYLLANGADPNRQKNEFGASVLAGLCYLGAADGARLLLAAGADVHSGREETRESPLHHALARCIPGDVDPERNRLIALLLTNGADPNSQTLAGVCSANHYFLRTRGETPLHRAAAWASPGAIELLLEAGANRNLADANGELPVDWAGWHRRDRHIGEMLTPHR